MMKMITKAYKFKMYPNDDQMRQIEISCNARIKAWNLALELHDAYYELHRKDPKEELLVPMSRCVPEPVRVDMRHAHSVLHTEGQKASLSNYDMGKMCKVWKDTVCPWFAYADAHSTRGAVRDLDEAFKAFYRRLKEAKAKGKPIDFDELGYPKYKKTHSDTKSYRTQNTRSKKKGGVYESIRIVDATHVLLPKLGVVKCRGDLSRVQGKIQNATIRKCSSGRYEVSLCCVDVPEPEMEMGMVDVMGVRIGVSDVTRSDGIAIANPKAAKKLEKKLAREQRRESRKKKGSSNYRKQKLKVAKVHERIANMRRSHMHEVTKQIVRDSKAVAVGKPDVQGMTKKKKGEGRSVQRKQNKALLDVAPYELTRQLKYKSEWYGRDFVELENGLPWTRTCSRCGEETGPTQPGTKTWTCPKCGTTHDTAMNAATNIKFEGAAEIEMRK